MIVRISLCMPIAPSGRSGMAGPGSLSANLVNVSTRSTVPSDSLVAQGDDRVEAGGEDGGVDAEDDADAGGDAQGQGDAPRGHHGGHAREVGDDPGQQQPDAHADDAAGGGKHHRFDQELGDDLTSLGSDGAAAPLPAPAPARRLRNHRHPQTASSAPRHG